LKVPPHFVDVVDVGYERDLLRPDTVPGLPTSSLVVVDEPECIRQSIEVWQEIGGIEIGSTVKDDHRLSPPDISSVKRRLSNRDTAFARGRAAAGLDRARRV
jgi:hypothetical protein